MHAHIILAHPEPKSFNGHLGDVAKKSFRDLGWTASVSDLNKMNFDPCERSDFYSSPQDTVRFNVQAEQRYASEQETILQEIKNEIEKLDSADLLILC